MTGYWMQVRRVDGFYTLKAVFHRLLSTIVVRYRLLYEFLLRLAGFCSTAGVEFESRLLGCKLLLLSPIVRTLTAIRRLMNGLTRERVRAS